MNVDAMDVNSGSFDNDNNFDVLMMTGDVEPGTPSATLLGSLSPHSSPCYELSMTRASTWVEITKTCGNLRNWELSLGVPDDGCERLLALRSNSRSKWIEGKKPVDCWVRGIENTKVIVNWRYLQDDLKFIYTTGVWLWKGIAKVNIWCDIMQYN